MGQFVERIAGVYEKPCYLPNVGESYHYIRCDYRIGTAIFAGVDDPSDILNLKHGNCFPTKEVAQNIAALWATVVQDYHGTQWQGVQAAVGQEGNHWDEP